MFACASYFKDREDGGSTVLRSIEKFVPKCTASHPTRQVPVQNLLSDIDRGLMLHLLNIREESAARPQTNSAVTSHFNDLSERADITVFCLFRVIWDGLWAEGATSRVSRPNTAHRSVLSFNIIIGWHGNGDRMKGNCLVSTQHEFPFWSPFINIRRVAEHLCGAADTFQYTVTNYIDISIMLNTSREC